MGTFTISQSQPGQNVWLYPTGNGCVVDLSPSAGQNWECCDELKDANDDDGSYVSSDATSIVTDLYLTAESVVSNLSGTINYVQVYSRAKSHLYPQHVDGIFKILLLLDPSECTDGGMYKSGDFDLATGYQTFNYVWNTNPSTATLWAWADIEDLQIGLQCSSPTLTDYLTYSTFRPNAVGDKAELSINWPWEGIVENYEMVDDLVPNLHTYNDTVYIVRNAGVNRDIHHIPNHTTEVGTIVNVTVYYVVLAEANTDPYAQAVIKYGGTEYVEPLRGVSNIWTTYSYTWNVNPSTGTAWSWAQIDALQIGVGLLNSTGWIHCTQVYAVVNYYLEISPEIRTTQVYAKINYDAELECTLNKPQEVSVDHDRNLKMLNFWSGNRVVYDIGRNRKTMVISGMQYGDSSCTDMECIKAMGKYGGEIITTGMGGNFDDTFRILSFGWKKITDKPLTFEWVLELEYANLDET